MKTGLWREGPWFTITPSGVAPAEPSILTEGPWMKRSLTALTLFGCGLGIVLLVGTHRFALASLKPGNIIAFLKQLLDQAWSVCVP